VLVTALVVLAVVVTFAYVGQNLHRQPVSEVQVTIFTLNKNNNSSGRE
jgi:hypothetical protein